MGLSCSCEYEWDGEGWCFLGKPIETPMSRKRATKCCSCGARIAPGEMAVRHGRMRGPKDYIEERIKGDKIYLAPWWHCEKCGDLYWSLDALGYCVNPADDVRDLVKEYAELKAEEAARKFWHHVDV